MALDEQRGERKGGRLYNWFVLYRRMRQLYCGLVPVRHLFVTVAFTFILQYEIAGSYTNSVAYCLLGFELARQQQEPLTPTEQDVFTRAFVKLPDLLAFSKFPLSKLYPSFIVLSLHDIPPPPIQNNQKRKPGPDDKF